MAPKALTGLKRGMHRTRIGYLHQPFGGLNNQQNAMNGDLFLQRAMLQYKLSDKTTVTFDYQALPSQMISPYGYGYPYSSLGRFLREE